MIVKRSLQFFWLLFDSFIVIFYILYFFKTCCATAVVRRFVFDENSPVAIKILKNQYNFILFAVCF